MKWLVICIGLAVAAPALAQEQKPVAQKPAAAKKSKKQATVAKKTRRQEDARHCLERPTNTEIIKCAEAYL
jgi:hypothetical protein